MRRELFDDGVDLSLGPSTTKAPVSEYYAPCEARPLDVRDEDLEVALDKVFDDPPADVLRIPEQ